MKKILVVDDEDMNLMSTKFILSKSGYEVVTADSGLKGIELLREQEFDMLLLDVEMPVMNGIETLRKIRAIPEIAHIKVSFLTASSSQEYLSEAIHLGAKEFIKKPCMPTELIRSIEKVYEERDNLIMLVVDDEPLNLELLRMTFESSYHVECASSGEAALNFIRSNIPDIIILDLNMPYMDGRETYRHIKKIEGCSGIPVVFLTAYDDEETELELFREGAMEFISKPFIPEIMKERIRRLIELTNLQNVLHDEIERKTNDLVSSNRKIKKLSEQIIHALTSAIDAKDAYTNGHSNRVAAYSREIAIRMGKSEVEVNDIYYAAMLHDVGKIGIDNDIINKPGRLTEEEFAIVKEHPVKGATILKQISEMPSLSYGARWHHERYDGKGYPDGLAGEEIPEIARIICVADCYDAMSSDRSYRKALPQNVVRAEIEKGRGTQFDADIADIMLKMIDEDSDYEMREMSEIISQLPTDTARS